MVSLKRGMSRAFRLRQATADKRASAGPPKLGSSPRAEAGLRDDSAPNQRLAKLWFPVGSEFRSENEPHDIRVAGGAGLHSIRLQILIVDAPPGRGHSWVDVVHQAI